MNSLDDDYVRPVGFAREPAEERRRWLLRIFTVLVVAFVVWLAITRVITPPSDAMLPTPFLRL